MDTRYYVSAARVTVGTMISAESETLEVIHKARLVNGMYRIQTRQIYGEPANRCCFADDYTARHILHIAAGVSR